MRLASRSTRRSAHPSSSSRANADSKNCIVSETRTGDVVVLPEGMLPGYGEDLAPLAAVERGEPCRRTGGPACQTEAGANVLRIADGIGRRMVQRRAVLPGQRRLPGLPEDQPRYERTWPIAPGDQLPTIDIPHPDGRITAGVQLCREIRFPEQWQYLAAAGAQLFVYLTYAANTREPEGVWRSHLISRAAENQRFVASANIADPNQHCPSMVVSPRGEVLGELPRRALRPASAHPQP